MKKCKHPFGWTQLVTRCLDFHVLIATWCSACRDYVPLGKATDTPATAIEVRAAVLAADFVKGVGIGGHRPDHCTGEHCWHWFEADHSEDADQCCYCGHDGIVLPGIENDCLAGYLARCIVSHEDPTP